LRHDHRPQFLSHVHEAELRFLGIRSNPALLRESEGNGCAKRLIRTLKEQLLWVEPFATVEDLRRALRAFQDRYNRDWLFDVGIATAVHLPFAPAPGLCSPREGCHPIVQVSSKDEAGAPGRA
jgi:hypothetical protein